MLSELSQLIGGACTAGQAVSVLITYTVCFSAIIIAIIVATACVIGINKRK